MVRTTNGESELCFGDIQPRKMVTRCKSEPGTFITRAIHWTRGGREILAFARRDALGQAGIMRWRSKRPFSPDPSDWSAGAYVTEVGQQGEGAIDAAVSPDGKRLAVAASFGGAGFRLYLTRRGDFNLAQATKTRVRACKLAWRPDSKQLAVVEADARCEEDVGVLARLSVASPNATHTLSAKADNPAFEPLAVTP